MITQPDSHLDTRLAPPEVQQRPPIQLPGRPAPQESRATGTRTPNIALAGFQLLLGYEWLLAGGDKILLGSFPAQLGGLLNTLVNGGHLVGFFAAILQVLVAPNAVLFGYLIESGETLAGLGLLSQWAGWVDRQVMGYVREAVRVRRPAPGETGAICRTWRGTARGQLLLPGWAPQAVVRPYHCLRRFD